MRLKTFEGLFLSKEEWKERFIKIIEDEGAIEPDDNKYGIYPWKLDTKYGILNIKIDLDDGTPAIFMKFEDPEKSKHLIGVNEYSGKWNIFEWNIEEVYRQFKIRINEVKLSAEEKAAKKYNL